MNISSNFRSKDALNSLHTLLNANNVESYKKSIDDLSLLWAVQADNVDFSKLAKDDFRTSLIPDIDCKQASHPVSVVLKSTANGDCLYNSISLFLCGDETRTACVFQLQKNCTPMPSILQRMKFLEYKRHEKNGD